MEFRYDEIDRDVLILVADGGLNSDTSTEFVAQIETLVDTGLDKIIVDCEKLTHISSSGIGVLIRLHQRMKAQGGDVKICGIRGIVPQVLQLTRLDKVFQIYPDVNRARLDFRPRTPPTPTPTPTPPSTRGDDRSD